MSETKHNEKLTQLSKNASQQIVEEKTGASEQKFENQREHYLKTSEAANKDLKDKL